ncbi:hypothetical protein BD410DRAFT_513545 [Rickenella mellea]|uniref:Uncharacterized protein n=1 Tax=Rickenella mellea TaxID=50990 RepID=A0A4Y7PSJ4_9AGAM|nr:hypothetical protein BD410DRAFT_513545 [Rickenella mellea]
MSLSQCVLFITVILSRHGRRADVTDTFVLPSWIDGSFIALSRQHYMSLQHMVERRGVDWGQMDVCVLIILKSY